MRIGEPRLAEDDLGSRPRERRRQRLELLDDIVLPADDRRPVQRNGAGRRAEACRVLREPVNPSRPYQGLLRDSPPVDARSAERPPVDESDPRRQGDGRFQRVDARRPASEDDQVIALQGDLPVAPLALLLPLTFLLPLTLLWPLLWLLPVSLILPLTLRTILLAV